MLREHKITCNNSGMSSYMQPQKETNKNETEIDIYRCSVKCENVLKLINLLHS